MCARSYSNSEQVFCSQMLMKITIAPSSTRCLETFVCLVFLSRFFTFQNCFNVCFWNGRFRKVEKNWDFGDKNGKRWRLCAWNNTNDENQTRKYEEPSELWTGHVKFMSNFEIRYSILLCLFIFKSIYFKSVYCASERERLNIRW